jgi:hypothetical protein
VAVDRTTCARYKEKVDIKLKERGLSPEWSDVIISEAQNDEPELQKFHYGKQKQDELIDYFKLTPAEWVRWNQDRFGDGKSKWRPPLKISYTCVAQFDQAMQALRSPWSSSGKASVVTMDRRKERVLSIGSCASVWLPGFAAFTAAAIPSRCIRTTGH